MKDTGISLRKEIGEWCMNGIVNVLISTYNGEKYIRSQIRSIQRQTYPNIRIYVRDDGSSDGTIQILEEYASKNEIILVGKDGKNLGYGRSFLTLLRESEEGDFWAFCDQDDVWHPRKIEWSLEWLMKQRTDIPAMAGNSYVLVTEDLKGVIGENRPPAYRFDFRRSITDCLIQGFVMTINAPLRDLMLRCKDENLISHDWWGVMLAEKFGRTYFDKRIAAKHRRLEDSISVMSLRNRFQWLKRTIMTGDSSIKASAKEYERLFGKEHPDRDARIVHWFTHDTYHFADSMKKALYPGRWRPTISSEFVLRFLMLIGKI